MAFAHAENRRQAIKEALALLNINPVKGQNIILKPNFNSPDPFPGTTDEEAFQYLIEHLREMGCQSITVADRSGMGDTREVMRRKGIFALEKRLDFKAVVLDELPASEWKHFRLKGSHWLKGVEVPSLFLSGDPVIQTCCLKTHRFGGHFTLSLKNSVGMIAKRSKKRFWYDYMWELHASPFQRKMIAEINQLYQPALVIMDAVEAFVEGGPEQGAKVKPGVVLASTDRVAIDAVGVAILRHFGTTKQVSKGKIFDQEQIRRAAELNLGARGCEQIELVASADPKSLEVVEKIRAVLLQG